MSAQPPRAAPAATTAAMVLVLADDDIVASLWKIEHMPRKIEHVSGIRQLGTHGGTQAPARQLALTLKEEISVVPRHRIVERRLDRIAGPRRADQPGRHDDGEIGLVLLKRPACEQRAEHRHVTEPGHLLLVGLADILQEPTDDEALAVAHLDRGARTTHDERGNRRQAGSERDGIVEIE